MTDIEPQRPYPDVVNEWFDEGYDAGHLSTVSLTQNLASEGWFLVSELTLAWALHNAGIGCMQPLAMSRDICVPDNPHYADFHPAAATAILAHLGRTPEKKLEPT